MTVYETLRFWTDYRDTATSEKRQTAGAVGGVSDVVYSETGLLGRCGSQIPKLGHRRNITRLRPSLSGYQAAACFYSGTPSPACCRLL